MKLALIGYGKMGHEIEKIALKRNHTIHCIIDIDNTKDFKSEKFKECDVAIEFTSPKVVLTNIFSCFEANVPIVTGTTGWHDQLEMVTKKCNEGRKTLFHSSNYSIGVNLFLEINEMVAKIMNNFPDYNVSMKESHHIHKLDAPSGTAISLAERIIKNLDRKESWTLGEAKSDEISIEAIREGEIVGIHDVYFQSDVDSISLIHHAKNRSGFAYGAVLSAEYIKGKSGVYTMKDLLKT
ncbi:MAG: 4-hydroxy-tetrahydrodipicolinate reductase [Bacteroidales bacterium]|nr:4-hydroxy-tetrahydrodipicolinate reductase [Bacteroidales bacterium]